MPSPRLTLEAMARRRADILAHVVPLNHALNFHLIQHQSSTILGAEGRPPARRACQTSSDAGAARFGGRSEGWKHLAPSTINLIMLVLKRQRVAAVSTTVSLSGLVSRILHTSCTFGNVSLIPCRLLDECLAFLSLPSFNSKVTATRPAPTQSPNSPHRLLPIPTFHVSSSKRQSQ